MNCDSGANWDQNFHAAAIVSIGLERNQSLLADPKASLQRNDTCCRDDSFLRRHQTNGRDLAHYFVIRIPPEQAYLKNDDAHDNTIINDRKCFAS